MRTLINFYKITVLIGMTVLLGCSEVNRNPKEISFMELFPSIALNQKLRLELPQNPLGGTGITLLLENVSSDQIQISPDAEIQIYYFSADQEWIRIPDLATYHGNIRTLAPKNHGLESGSLASCNPDLSAMDDVTQIRIAVFGTITKNGSSGVEKTGAYLDVDLK